MSAFEDFERIDLPNGMALFYRDSDHSYWQSLNGKGKGEYSGSGRLTGVTTVVAPFGWDGTNSLMRWAVRINLAGVATLIDGWLAEAPESPPEWARDPDEIWQRLKEHSLTDEDVRDQAGERGSNIHYHTLNALAAGQPVPDLSLLTSEEQGYAHAVIEFWLDHDPEAYQAEQVVADIGLKVAGRLDFRGRLKSRCQDKKCPCHRYSGEQTGLLDLKTSNYIGNAAFVQVAAYDALSRTSGYGPSDYRLILKAKEDGTYRLMESRADLRDFLSALEIYRRAAQLSKYARAEARARQEA